MDSIDLLESISSTAPEVYIGICCASVGILLLVQHIFPLKALSKTLAAACFLCVAMTRDVITRNDMYANVIGLGLIFGAIGDICLLPSSTGIMFLLGLISFLFGHICYIIAFSLLPYNLDWILYGGIFAVIRSMLIWVFLNRAAKENNKKNKKSKNGMKSLPVILYIIVITLMVAGSIGNFGAAYHQFHSVSEILKYNPGVFYRFIGAELFYFSDICVARERFVVKSPINKYLGLPLYFGGQLLIAYWI